MVIRIEILSKVLDTRAAVRKIRLTESGFPIEDIFLADVFTISKTIPDSKLPRIAEMLCIPVTQQFDIRIQGKSPKTSLKQQKFDYAIEVGFLPGVTDNVAHTAREEIEDYLKTSFKQSEGVYTSQIAFIKGKISQKEVEAIASSFYNPLIQRVSIKSYAQYTTDKGMDFIVPVVNLTKKPTVTDVDLNISDEELKKIGKEGIKNADGTRRGPLALDLTYMKTIQAYFKKLGRKPTDIEIESIAQTWSEHCKHTIFANPLDEIKDGLFKQYIKRATEEIRASKKSKDLCVSVFTDNSGAIAFDDEHVITHKMETHNTPSSLDPFGGSITSVVGVNRDTLGFGLGAKPIANIFGFCVANPEKDIPFYKGKNFTQKMLSSRRIFDGVVAGINAGGNQSGIPTPQGFIYFDEGYRGKPLVFAGTIGIIPRKVGKKLSHIKKALPGDYIVMIGGRVGKDGIHGATFSSEVLNSESPVSAVQIGDPITQKKFSDALVYEARDKDLYNSITDNGAGGLSCSVAEMARESGGCVVDLEKVPLKYPGLEPWEIWISESQERMTLAVPKNKWKDFQDLMKRRDVEATIIGEFTNSGNCVVRYNKKVIFDLDMNFLHNGLPKEQQKTSEKNVSSPEPHFSEPKNLTKTLQEMLSRQNIASFLFISQQYDHIVQGNAVMGPLVGRGRINGDASVIRPVLSTQKGVVISQALYPLYSDRDSYRMAACCVDTAVRNALVAGADIEKIALLDNFCWCSSDDPHRLAQLKDAVKACYDYAVAYGTPYISGKDSMFNDFQGFDAKGKPLKISIAPTLLISSLGILEDSRTTISPDIKVANDRVYILGETYDELGGSEYYSMIEKGLGNSIPEVNAEKNLRLYNVYSLAAKKGLVASGISVRHGGLGVALAKMAMGGMLGMEVGLTDIPGSVSRDDYALFSESQGRIIVTVNPKKKTEFERLFEKLPIKEIGVVTHSNEFVVKGLRGNIIVKESVENLLKSYRSTFKDY